MAKKKPQDATRRNVQAANKRLALLKRTVARLSTRVMMLEHFARRVTTRYPSVGR